MVIVVVCYVVGGLAILAGAGLLVVVAGRGRAVDALAARRPGQHRYEPGRWPAVPDPRLVRQVCEDATELIARVVDERDATALIPRQPGGRHG